MTDLASEIAEFCRNVMARPCKRDELIFEITKMAIHNPAWPTASYKIWSDAIDEAIKRGLLDKTCETIWIPTKKQEAKPKQMGLF